MVKSRTMFTTLNKDHVSHLDGNPIPSLVSDT